MKEVILVAQDLGSYGRENSRRSRLPALIRELSLLEGLFWIRIMYMHPATTTAGIVRAMAESPKVVPYIDLPVQHVSEKVLKAMGRKGGPVPYGRPWSS